MIIINNDAREYCRVFTFGIGSGASTELVNGLAKAGNGSSEFIKEGDRMQSKVREKYNIILLCVAFQQVISSLKKALQPSVTDVKLTFSVPPGVNVLQSPNKIPPVFNGDKLVMYGILKGGKAMSGTATLSGNILGRPMEHVIEFSVTGGESDNGMPVVHQLAAKGLIRDWEGEGDKKKGDIIKMSTESGVVSSYTAYVAIDEEQDKPIAGALKIWDLTAVGDQTVSFMSTGLKGRGGGIRMARSAGPVRLKGAGPLLGISASSGFAKKRKMKPAAAPAPAYACSYDVFLPSSVMDSVQSLESSDDEEDEECFAPRMKSTARNSSSSSRSQPAPSSGLSQLISLQAAEGFWILNDLLASLTGVSLSVLKSACPDGVSGNVWATVLALVLLEKRFNSQRDEWELVAMKAEMWVQGQPLTSTIESLKATASQSVK